MRTVVGELVDRAYPWGYKVVFLTRDHGKIDGVVYGGHYTTPQYVVLGGNQYDQILREATFQEVVEYLRKSKS